MGLLDSALDKAGSALGALAGAGGAAAAPSKPAKYERDVPLSDDAAKTGGAAGPTPDGSGKPVPFDFGIPIEFIHYGQVHADLGKQFPHGKFPPSGKVVAPSGHAIMFRDGLERECILLFGFISSTKVILKEYLQDKGPLGDVGALVGGLLGGGPTAPKPDPSQLDSFIGKVKSTADKIKPASIKYPDTHEAGMTLHQARADYIAFCESLNSYYLKPPESGGVAGAVGGAIASVPGVGNIIQVIQRFLFKMFDIYLGVYLELRKDHERLIEMASHQMTIDAIKGKYETFELVYPVWFPKTEEAESGGGGNNLLQPVTDAVDDVKKEVESIKDKIYDFAGASDKPKDTPGTSQMDAIFTALKGDKKDSAVPGPPTAADATIKALNTMLSDIGSLPKFLETPIKEVTAANIALLEDVFRRLMASKAAGKIEPADLLEGGRHYLTGMIAGLATKLIVGMLPGGSGGDFQIQGLSVKELLGHHLDELLGKYTEPILKIAIGELAGQLEESRAKAEKEKAQTMEVLLGRLPWLIALMFRNTFFPVWNLVAKEIFGKVLGPLAGPLDSANSTLDKARDTVDDVEEKKRRAEKLKEVADEGANVGSGGSNLNKYKDAVDNETEEGKKREAERQAEKDKNEAMKKFFKSNGKDDDFPVTGRIVEGEGVKVKEKIPSVLEKTV